MSKVDLLIDYKGLSWINCPEYAETVLRLLTVEELDQQACQWIPVWKEQTA